MAEQADSRRLKIVYGIADALISVDSRDLQNIPIGEIKKAIGEVYSRDRRWNLGLQIQAYNGNNQGEAVGRLMRIREALAERIQGVAPSLGQSSSYGRSEQPTPMPEPVHSVTPKNVQFKDDRRGQKSFWWQKD